jgi:hypothetical protein
MAGSANLMFVYRRRDILTPMLTDNLLKEDLKPKIREYTGADLPAALVPVEAYNTLSLLIPTSNEQMLQKFGGRLTNGVVTGSIYYSGADPVENTSRHLHAFNTSHIEELQIALTPPDYKSKVHLTVHPYEQGSRTPDVIKSELKLGPLMRAVDSNNSLEGLERIRAHFPMNFDDFMKESEEGEYIRNRICGNFTDGINKGKSRKTSKCYNQVDFQRIIMDRDASAYATAREGILQMNIDSNRFQISVWCVIENIGVQVITTKTPSYADRQEHSFDMKNYCEVRTYLSHDVCVNPSKWQNWYDAARFPRNDNIYRRMDKELKGYQIASFPAKGYYNASATASPGDIFVPISHRKNSQIKYSPKEAKLPKLNLYHEAELKGRAVEKYQECSYNSAFEEGREFTGYETSELARSKLRDPVFTDVRNQNLLEREQQHSAAISQCTLTTDHQEQTAWTESSPL